MGTMTSFRYVEFWDVPRCIALRYRDHLILMQSFFDEAIDEYQAGYSTYVIPDAIEDAIDKGSWAFLTDTPMICLGEILVGEVAFDESKRKFLDASCLDHLIDSL